MRTLSGSTRALSPPNGGARLRFTPPVHYMPRSRVVSVEQTANIVGGACWPLAPGAGGCGGAAKAAGLALRHRHAGCSPPSSPPAPRRRRFAAPFDSVWIDLTKGLGAPVGAVLAGSARLHRGRPGCFKQRFGGAMRQAGIVAAAGIYALEHNVERLGG